MTATRFTPEVRGHLVSAMRLGLGMPEACAEIALSLDTAKGWMARGRREPECEFGDFATAVAAAREAAEAQPLFEEDLIFLLRRGSTPDASHGRRKDRCSSSESGRTGERRQVDVDLIDQLMRFAGEHVRATEWATEQNAGVDAPKGA